MNEYSHSNKEQLVLLILLLGISAVILLRFLSPKPAIIDDVPYISQTERYPTGCESVSTVMALNYLGIDITVDQFINDYLDKGTLPHLDQNGKKIGSNPRKAFPGNPFTLEGYGCFAPVIVNAVNKFIDNDKYEILELYGKSLDELCGAYVKKGIPVILWATIDMKPPRPGNSWIDEQGETINWIIPQHCVLLIGYDDNYYYFNDPMQSKMCKYDKIKVKAAYEGMNKQAVVIQNKKINNNKIF